MQISNNFFPLSDTMDLHQSSDMCIIMLGGEDTHPWYATKVGNPIPATIPVAKRNYQQTTHTSHYRSRPVEFSFEAAVIYRFKKTATCKKIYSNASLSLKGS